MHFPAPHYGLALHTSSPDLGLAISNFAGDSRQHHWNLGRDTSNLLHSYLAEFLQPQTWQDLMFIAVAKGPGGFTGTRIGVVAARTLAQQLDIPLFTISTLAALAWNRRSAFGGSTDIAVEMSAQRGDVFGAMYRINFANSPQQATSYQSAQREVSTNLAAAHLTTLLPDAVLSPNTWQQTLENWQGSYQLIQAEGGLGTSVNGVLELAYSDWQQGKRPHWSEALPFYGQHPVEM